MKLYEISDADTPLQFLLLQKKLAKGPVYTWMPIARGIGDTKAVITSIEMKFDKKIARPYISIDTRGADAPWTNAVDSQVWFPTSWDNMKLTNSYEKGKPGEWWLLDSANPT